jgi:hypothetical protein
MARGSHTGLREGKLSYACHPHVVYQPLAIHWNQVIQVGGGRKMLLGICLSPLPQGQTSMRMFQEAPGEHASR